ncbi:unnamed protein product [Ilex paraguariensis]|uniref:Uncharacterized protein n=1 Tax=Ilex paraguariensis TaxID=185542 RepID=A0ABC8U226_9AQUA
MTFNHRLLLTTNYAPYQKSLKQKYLNRQTLFHLIVSLILFVQQRSFWRSSRGVPTASFQVIQKLRRSTASSLSSSPRSFITASSLLAR